MTMVGPYGAAHVNSDRWSHYHADARRVIHTSGYDCSLGVAEEDLAKDAMIQANLIEAVTGARMERIVWVDSGLSFANVWCPEETITERADEWDGQVTTVGQIVHETDDRVVLCMSHDKETGAWSQCFLIYKPCIVSRESM